MTKSIFKQKNLLYFLLNLLGIIIFVAFLDFCIGSLLNTYYYKIKSGTIALTTYSIEKTSADIVIFGSSRASHHYQPNIFENTLKLTCYNVGKDGERSTLYHFAVLEGILKRYTPKIIILDFLNGEFGKTLYTYDMLSSLTPYYSNHPEMRNIIELRSKFEKLKLLSKIYQFNSLGFSIIADRVNLRSSPKEDIRGYIPIISPKYITAPIAEFDYTKPYDLDSTKINIYRAFVKTCIEKKIKLYIVSSPYYLKAIGEDNSVKIAKEIASQYNVPFIDMAYENFFIEKPYLFYNYMHLNDSGAKIFSTTLAKKIVENAK